MLTLEHLLPMPFCLAFVLAIGSCRLAQEDTDGHNVGTDHAGRAQPLFTPANPSTTPTSTDAAIITSVARIWIVTLSRDLCLSLPRPARGTQTCNTNRNSENKNAKKKEKNLELGVCINFEGKRMQRNFECHHLVSILFGRRRSRWSLVLSASLYWPLLSSTSFPRCPSAFQPSFWRSSRTRNLCSHICSSRSSNRRKRVARNMEPPLEAVLVHGAGGGAWEWMLWEVRQYIFGNT